LNAAAWLLLAGGGAVLLWLYGWPAWRRRRALSQPLDPAWPASLAAQCHWYRRLPRLDRLRLQRLMVEFLEHVTFVGLGGLEVGEPMRLKVAAEACRMRLGLGPPVFPAVRFIYLYPGPWRARIHEESEDGVVHEGEDERSGETWHEGLVFLAWDEIAAAGETGGAAGAYHLVAHEFAHVLDHEWGLTAGIDERGELENGVSGTGVRACLAAEYRALCAAEQAGWALWLDDYATADPAEFFAVASEAYFDRRSALATARPALHDCLRKIYRDGKIG